MDQSMSSENLHETFWMVEFTVGVDYFRFWFKAEATSGTCHALHVDNTEKDCLKIDND